MFGDIVVDDFMLGCRLVQKGNIICNRDILIIRVFLLLSKGIFPKIDISFESSYNIFNRVYRAGRPG
jgi:hypothetical protein